MEQRHIIRRALLLPLLTALLGMVAFPPADGATRFDPIGHRGYTASRTENTLPAIRAAVRRGAAAVEVDVRVTRDAKMVLMHDRGVARTTDGRGYVDRMTSAQIAELRTPDGARVPFVRQAARVARRLGTTLVLELKSGPDRGWTRWQVRELRRVLVKRQMFNRSLVFSFNAELLRRVEGAVPGFETSWILRRWPSLRKIRRQGVDNVSMPVRVVGRRKVRRLERHGISAFGRNANRRWSWERFERAGVTGVVTDRVPAYVDWGGNG